MQTEFISHWKELGTAIYLQLINFIALLFYGITQIYTGQTKEPMHNQKLSLYANYTGHPVIQPYPQQQKYTLSS